MEDDGCERQADPSLLPGELEDSLEYVLISEIPILEAQIEKILQDSHTDSPS